MFTSSFSYAHAYYSAPHSGGLRILGGLTHYSCSLTRILMFDTGGSFGARRTIFHLMFGTEGPIQTTAAPRDQPSSSSSGRGQALDPGDRATLQRAFRVVHPSRGPFQRQGFPGVLRYDNHYGHGKKPWGSPLNTRSNLTVPRMAS